MTDGAALQMACPSGPLRPGLQPNGCQVPGTPIAVREYLAPVWARAVMGVSATAAIVWIAGAVIVIASVLLFWTALATLALGIWLRWRIPPRHEMSTAAASDRRPAPLTHEYHPARGARSAPCVEEH